MKDILYEESAAPVNSAKEASIYKVLKIISIILFVIGIIVLLPGLSRGYAYFFYSAESDSLYMFLSALIIAVVILIFAFTFFFWKNRFNVIYDYSFVSGDLRISRVIGNRRKFLYTIKSDEISKIGKVSSYGYFSIKNNKAIKEIKLTKNKIPSKGKSFYYLYCSTRMGKELLVIECREELIKYLSLYVSKDTIETE